MPCSGCSALHRGNPNENNLVSSPLIFCKFQILINLFYQHHTLWEQFIWKFYIINFFKFSFPFLCGILDEISYLDKKLSKTTQKVLIGRAYKKLFVDPWIQQENTFLLWIRKIISPCYTPITLLQPPKFNELCLYLRRIFISVYDLTISIFENRVNFNLPVLS